jgi:hypothetical protein
MEPCFKRDGLTPQQQFHFKPIGDVENMETRIVPIVAFNPYQGQWTIKARVIAKMMSTISTTPGEMARFSPFTFWM